MKAITKSVVTLAAAATAFALSPLGSAQASEGWSLDKTEYLPGETITLEYDVTSDCTGVAGSTGFTDHRAGEFKLDPPNIMRAKATAVGITGTYQAGMWCDGQFFGNTFKIIPASDTYRLSATVVESGGDISVIKQKVGSTCIGPATSPHLFQAPIELIHETPATWVGNGKVVETEHLLTGEVEMLCDGKPVRQTLQVKPKPVQPETKAPEAPKLVEKPKAKIVKPKGAPQTGAGATA